MICDPRPVFCLSEDGTDLTERQFAEDPQLEDFPVGLVHGMERGVDPEGGILVRDLLLDAPAGGREFFRDRAGLVPAARFVHETVFRDGAQPGDFIRFIPEGGRF